MRPVDPGCSGTPGQPGSFILPVFEIDSVQGVINWLNSNPHPLGLYIFAEDDGITDQILSRTESGDAVVNDCSLHPLVPGLPCG